MEVIGHQTVGRAEDVFAYRGMKHQFPKGGMEGRCKPATSPALKCVRPENNRVTLIMMPFQTGQIAFLIEGHACRILREVNAVKY